MIDQGQKLFDGTLEDFRAKYNSGFSLKLEFDGVPPVWQDDSRYELAEQTERHWIVKAPEGVTTKAAMIEMINRYNPANLYIQEERIEDIVRSAYEMK